MFFSDDMRELIRCFRNQGVDYAVCGGFAVAHYGFVRMTMDLDLLISPEPDNANRIMSALREFGFGEAGISMEDFLEPGAAVTLGEQPNQIDLLTSMNSTPAAEIIHRAIDARLGDLPVKMVAYRDLIQAKQEAGRPKDLIDLEELKRQNQEP
jgi:predicted nucleotidyltransferase